MSLKCPYYVIVWTAKRDYNKIKSGGENNVSYETESESRVIIQVS